MAEKITLKNSPELSNDIKDSNQYSDTDSTEETDVDKLVNGIIQDLENNEDIESLSSYSSEELAQPKKTPAPKRRSPRSIRLEKREQAYRKEVKTTEKTAKKYTKQISKNSVNNQTKQINKNPTNNPDIKPKYITPRHRKGKGDPKVIAKKTQFTTNNNQRQEPRQQQPRQQPRQQQPRQLQQQRQQSRQRQQNTTDLQNNEDLFCNFCSNQGLPEWDCHGHIPGPDCPTLQNTICNYCKESGHTKRRCPEIQAMICKKCNKIGHSAPRCRAKICSHCNKLGHLLEECNELYKKMQDRNKSKYCGHCNLTGHTLDDCKAI